MLLSVDPRASAHPMIPSHIVRVRQKGNKNTILCQNIQSPSQWPKTFGPVFIYGLVTPDVFAPHFLQQLLLLLRWYCAELVQERSWGGLLTSASRGVPMLPLGVMALIRTPHAAHRTPHAPPPPHGRTLPFVDGHFPLQSTGPRALTVRCLSHLAAAPIGQAGYDPLGPFLEVGVDKAIGAFFKGCLTVRNHGNTRTNQATNTRANSSVPL